MKIFLPSILVFLFLSNSVFSQEMRIAKGTVVDSIPINDSISDSFSLYLPQNFENDRPWPVLFIIDPEGRGRLATQLFRGISEEQSYIIAASNEKITSDSLQENLPKISRFMSWVMGSFPVDPNLIYVGGLAEGGRLASAVPLIYNVRGVLAVGDGWVNTDVIDKKKPYMFSAVSGEKDIKMNTLKTITEFFKKTGFPAEINYHENSNEEWPDTFVLGNAITGFTLDAMAKGFREKDENLVDQIFEKELENTEMLRRQRNYYQAFEKLQQLENKYSLFNIDEDLLSDKIKELRRSKAFKEQRRDYRRAAITEVEKQDEYLYYMEMDIVSANFDNIGWWEFELEELEKEKQQGNIAEQKVSQRLESFLRLLSKNNFDRVMASDAGIDVKIYTSVLRTVLDKNDPEAYLTIIGLAGHDGDIETAMLYLEDLLKTGYKDLDALYSIDGILDLKFSPEYNNLIREYLGEAKYYRNQTENSGNDEEEVN